MSGQVHAALLRNKRRLDFYALLALVVFFLYVILSLAILYSSSPESFARAGALAVASGVILFSITKKLQDYFFEYDMFARFFQSVELREDGGGGIRAREYTYIGARKANQEKLNYELHELSVFSFKNYLFAQKIVYRVEILLIVLGTLHWGFGDLFAERLVG